MCMTTWCGCGAGTCTRCAILLDELDADSDKLQGAPYLTAMAAAATNDEDEVMTQLDLSLLGRHVVVELKTANALPLLKYACSSRVIPLPTSQLNAQRVGVPDGVAVCFQPQQFQQLCHVAVQL